MRGNKTNLLGKTGSEISVLLSDHLDTKFRIKQIYSWIYEKKVFSFSQMTNLSKDLRQSLDEKFSIETPFIKETLTSSDGTVKFLISLFDGSEVEVVRMDEIGHYTLCLSSQAGCPLGCVFCATGRGGYERNLTSEEITSSAVMLIGKLPQPKPVNIVFMGMGEPLLNYEALAESIGIFTDPQGMAIPERRITVSTVGIKENVRKLKQDFPRIGVAVSVNSTFEPLRSQLMPVNMANPLEEIINELKKLNFTRENPVTLEFVLISGINDNYREARNLASLAKSLKAKVNIIPLNRINGYDEKSPSEEAINQFIREIADSKVNVTVRRSKGSSLDAACGQLKAGVMKR
jgi:23S rRNA (adenine2503-C2)-methyltransferase